MFYANLRAHSYVREGHRCLMQTSTKDTFKLYKQYALEQKGWFLLALIFIVLAVLAGLIPPILYKRFFDVVEQADSLVAIKSDLFIILFQLVGVYLVLNLGYRISAYGAIVGVTNAADAIYQKLFAHIHTRSYSFFSDTFTGSLVKKVNRFVSVFNRLFDIFFWDLIPLGIRIVFVTTALWLVSPVFGIILLCWALLFIVVAYGVIRYRVKLDIERYAADSAVTGMLADTITGAIPVKLFAAQERERHRFAKTTNLQKDLTKRSWMVDLYLNIFQGLFALVVEIGLMYFAIQLLVAGTISIGDIVLLQSYILLIGREVWELSHVLKRLFESLAEANEMTELYHQPIKIKDAHKAKKLQVKKGEVVFDGVDFGYNKTREILKDFHLQIAPGEKVALVGSSGAGKSTVTKLLLRLFDVTGGQVLIDGQDIKKVQQKSLHEQVALVPQDPILFHRTLLENIQYGNPKATKEQVVRAAKLAHAHEFIKDFPAGYDTYVGERGVKLSGGERQRVAIARAILKNAPILILDEATSSLDSESEKLIQDALQKLMKNKTTIVIAHRLSTIMAMDRIIVMEKGKIKEEGSHDDLLQKKKGLYKKLWELQAGGFLPE